MTFLAREFFTSIFLYVAELGDKKNSNPTLPVFCNKPVQVQNTILKDPFYCSTVAVGKK